MLQNLATRGQAAQGKQQGVRGGSGGAKKGHYWRCMVRAARALEGRWWALQPIQCAMLTAPCADVVRSIPAV